MDEHANSFWCLLPRDILGLILPLMDFTDFHSISAVCKNWKLACKSYCPPTPNDPIPWLLNYAATAKSTFLVERHIRVYRPLTNKTYKINLPDIGANCRFLHSKDAWLLLHFVDSVHKTYRLVLWNLFTLDKIDLPTTKLRAIRSRIVQGTFSTISKSPNCVIFVAENIRACTSDIHAWKIGSNSWKTYQLHCDYSRITFWLYDDHLYGFSGNRVMVFDNDLNLKRSHEFTFWIDTFNITERDRELFIVPWWQILNSDSYKFDRATLDWVKVNVRILIGFKNEFNCNIGIMVKEQWDEVFLQMKNLTKHGSLIMRKGEQVVVDINHKNQAWVDLR